MRTALFPDTQDLKPDPTNPRVHRPWQVRQIARSIEEFGFNVPVLIDSDLRVVAGHGRLLASKQLGWAQVPTILLDHLNKAQVQAFRIADNKLTKNSAWDDRLLAEQLKDLSDLELDFSLDITGFEMAEIDLRIESLEEQAGLDRGDALPETSSRPPVSCAEDLWLLDSGQEECSRIRQT